MFGKFDDPVEVVPPQATSASTAITAVANLLGDM
jgi:hypothetical protein